jgi:GTP-binding protein
MASPFHDVSFLISVAAPAQFPADMGAEVAFAGRSNAGKSSAINAITQRNGLARTSKTPGRTRLLNYFGLGAERRIVDLPGYGYASVPEAERRTWIPLLEQLRQRESLRGLFVIVDSRRGLMAGDEALLDWVPPGKHVHVLLAKADKLGRNDSRKALQAATQTLAGRGSVQLFSAHSGAGVDAAQARLQEWLR